MRISLAPKSSPGTAIASTALSWRYASITTSRPNPTPLVTTSRYHISVHLIYVYYIFKRFSLSTIIRAILSHSSSSNLRTWRLPSLVITLVVVIVSVGMRLLAPRLPPPAAGAASTKRSAGITNNNNLHDSQLTPLCVRLNGNGNVTWQRHSDL